VHGLASLCHEAGNGGNNGRRCPKHARTVFLPDLDSIVWVEKRLPRFIDWTQKNTQLRSVVIYTIMWELESSSIWAKIP